MRLVDLSNLLTASPALSPVAAVFGTTLFVGRRPEDPDTAYVIEEYGGRPPERTHNGTHRRFGRFQLVTRDPDPIVARDMAEAAYRRFNAFVQADLGTAPITYESIRPLGEPFKLHEDTMARTLIACNYEVWTEL